MHAEAVSAGGVVMEFRRNVRVHEGGVVDEGILAVTAIVLCLDEEGRRGELVGCVGGIEGRVSRGDG